jgi:hypothetical protein
MLDKSFYILWYKILCMIDVYDNFLQFYCYIQGKYWLFMIWKSIFVKEMIDYYIYN